VRGRTCRLMAEGGLFLERIVKNGHPTE